MFNTIQSKTPESVHSKAISVPNQRTRKQAYTHDIHKPDIIAKRIRSILLRGVEEQCGFIYVLKAPSFFQTFEPAKGKGEEWVEIGISRNLKRHIDSLKYNCGFTDLQECYRLDDVPMRMDLLRVIERVCHEEINNFRRTIQCTKGVNKTRCTSFHDEWLAVPEQVAVRTVKLWKRYLNCAPYAESGKLNDDWRDRLADDTHWQPRGMKGILIMRLRITGIRGGLKTEFRSEKDLRRMFMFEGLVGNPACPEVSLDSLFLELYKGKKISVVTLRVLVGSNTRRNQILVGFLAVVRTTCKL